MNIAAEEFDDQMAALLGNATDSEIDFPLPSQRKKASESHNTSGKRRRPASKPLMSLDKVLNSMSSSVAPTAVSPERPPPEQPSPPPTEVPPPTITSTSQLDRLDASLTASVTRAIDRVRQAFLDELRFWLDSTAEEDSMISAFLLGLPREMEEAVASEIALGRASLNPDRDTERLTNAIDSQLEALYRVIPQRGKRGEARPTLRSLSATVVAEKEQLSISIENVLSELKAERSGPRLGFGLGDQEADARRCQRVEAEANAKRLEVEQQALEAQKKRLQDVQKDGGDGDMEVEKGKEDPNELLLQKFAAVSDQISKSSFHAAVSNLSALAQTVKKNYEEVRNVRTQLELESDSVAAACRTAAEIKRRKFGVYQDLPDEPPQNIVEEAKKRLEFFASQRKRPRKFRG
jgi:hypothetical protein